jgi:micrococcal nuclease
MTKENYWKILLFFFLAVVALFLSFLIYELTLAPESKISITERLAPARGAIEESTETAPETAVVSRVIDGDTIVVEGEITVRLLGIDSDEKGYPCYQAAKDRLEELVLGKVVTLVASESDKDRYGRSLRYVFLGPLNTSVLMVSEGLAIAMLFPDNKLFREEITLAESEAKAAKRGCLWKEKDPTKNPAEEPGGEK